MLLACPIFQIVQIIVILRLSFAYRSLDFPCLKRAVAVVTAAALSGNTEKCVVLCVIVSLKHSRSKTERKTVKKLLCNTIVIRCALF